MCHRLAASNDSIKIFSAGPTTMGDAVSPLTTCAGDTWFCHHRANRQPRRAWRPRRATCNRLTHRPTCEWPCSGRCHAPNLHPPVCCCRVLTRLTNPGRQSPPMSAQYATLPNYYVASALAHLSRVIISTTAAEAFALWVARPRMPLLMEATPLPERVSH